MKALLAGAATFAALVLAADPAAKANVTFSDMNTGGIGETNILFDQVDTGTTIFGQIDHSGVNVAFSSMTGQTLQASGNGQADIQDLPNPGVSEMTSIDMKAAPGTAWGDVIINLDEAGGLSTGCKRSTPCTAKITAIDNHGNPFTTDVLESGNNYTTAIADTVGNPSMGIPAEFITQIQVVELPGENNPAFGWTDFKQPRVSGLCELVPGTDSCAPIPTSVTEPGSLLLLGFGVAAAWVLRRPRLAAAA